LTGGTTLDLLGVKINPQTSGDENVSRLTFLACSMGRESAPMAGSLPK